MNYYEILGVDKDANTKTIKAAYRKLAQKHHPDKEGGDTATFTAIQKAYEVLGDPDTRAHYDRYGVDRPSETMIDKAKPMVAALFSQVMNGTVDKYLNVLDVMCAILDVEESKALGILKNLCAERRKTTTVLHRLKRKGEDHLLIDLLNGRRKEIWKAYRDTQANIKTMGVAKGLLAGYEYDAEVSVAWRHYGQSSFFSSSTTR